MPLPSQLRAGRWRARRGARPGSACRRTSSRSEGRSSEPRIVISRLGRRCRSRRGCRSCSSTSRITRSLAVAVVASTAASAGSRSTSAGDPPVVGPEVVAPVGDAVGLVDDEQARGRDQLRQHVRAEARVGEPLGAEQQQVDLAGVDRLEGLVPVVAVGGVDGRGLDPERRRRPRAGCASARSAARRGSSAPRPGLAQHRRGDEVDGALAPAGALHAQHAAAVAARARRSPRAGPRGSPPRGCRSAAAAACAPRRGRREPWWRSSTPTAMPR